jgi:hypothetical protein
MTRHPPAEKLTLPARPAPLPKIDLSGVHPAGLHPAGQKQTRSGPAPAGLGVDRSLLDSRAGGQPPVDMTAMQAAHAAPAAGHAGAGHPMVDPAALPGPRVVPAWEPNG